jgi:hypothetical protein
VRISMARILTMFSLERRIASPLMRDCDETSRAHRRIQRIELLDIGSCGDASKQRVGSSQPQWISGRATLFDECSHARTACRKVHSACG